MWHCVKVQTQRQRHRAAIEKGAAAAATVVAPLAVDGWAQSWHMHSAGATMNKQQTAVNQNDRLDCSGWKL